MLYNHLRKVFFASSPNEETQSQGGPGHTACKDLCQVFLTPLCFFATSGTCERCTFQAHACMSFHKHKDRNIFILTERGEKRKDNLKKREFGFSVTPKHETFAEKSCWDEIKYFKSCLCSFFTVPWIRGTDSYFAETRETHATGTNPA